MTTQVNEASVSDQDSPKTFEKFSPVTGELLKTYDITSEAEVLESVARARAAFPLWRDTPLKTRLKILGRIKDVVRVGGEEYARRISEDSGKPYVDALVTELMSIPLFLDHYRRTASDVLGRKKVRTPLIFPGKKSYVEHFPMGVIGIISPWNFPFQLAMIPTLSALIAGNTVVLKPSEITPITGEIIDEIFRRIGLPRGVVEVIQGDGSTGAALTSSKVDKLFFTGSVPTGRRVMKAAAERPIPVELELGGKDPMIVCADANLERAARGAAWGGLLNCGQMCISVERLFVEETVHDKFVGLLKREIDRMRVGSPDEHADMGPFTSADQRELVEGHIKGAIEAGATLIRGGERIDRPGLFFAPTLITDVTPEMEIYREETFGPVIPVIKVKNAEEALRLANDHQYGLTGSVWTSDMDKGMNLASRMECGQVMINDVAAAAGNPAIPFGGVKNSGFGRYHGPDGLLAFSHPKAIMVDRGRFDFEPLWFPYGKKYEPMSRLFDGLLSNNLPKAALAIAKLRRLTSNR